MPTQCNTKPLEFEPHGRRRVVADFDGGPITSDAGLLLLRRVDRHLSVTEREADSGDDRMRIFGTASPPFPEKILCIHVNKQFTPA